MLIFIGGKRAFFHAGFDYQFLDSAIITHFTLHKTLFGVKLWNIEISGNKSPRQNL
jgi:hypothetical protein